MLTWLILAVISLAAFGMLLLWAVKRKSMPLMYGAVAAFLLSAVFGLLAVFRFSYISYKMLDSGMRQQSK